jgi:protease I
MAKPLEGYRVAVLAVDGFEEVELVEPKRELTAAGAVVHVISASLGAIQGFRHVDKGDIVDVDATFGEVAPKDYDAVVLPGGAVNGDAIGAIPQAQAFVRAVEQANKPVAVIGYGVRLAISAGIVGGRRITSQPGLRDDIRHAGGRWIDAQIVEDRNLISSGGPDELPALDKKLMAQLWIGGEPRVDPARDPIVRTDDATAERPTGVDEASRDSNQRVSFPDDLPQYDDANGLVRFVAEIDGVAVPCSITALALEDHFGAASAHEAALIEAFRDGRARIQSVCAEALAESGGIPVVLCSEQFLGPRIAQA